MKKLRVISTILVLTMLCAMLAGCGSKEGTTSNTDSDLSGDLVYPDNTDITQSGATGSASYHTAVSTCGSYTLDNQLLNYYYWTVAFNGLYSSYSSYISTDTPLAEQYISDGYSLQDLLISNAISAWQGVACYLQEAKAQGYVMTGEYLDTINSLEETITSSAETAGYTDVDEYLKVSYGESADYDSFYNFYNDYFTALSFMAEKQAEYDAQYAGETTNTINVRHILIAPEDVNDSESWQAALDKANAIYADWQTVGTEDYFAELATANTADTGSSANGGLYEGVYPGQMVTSFNDWCFDASRQSGDTDIVATDYGYHIMYFVGVNDELYEDYGSYLADKAMSAYETDLTAKYPSDFTSDNAVIYFDFGGGTETTPAS